MLVLEQREEQWIAERTQLRCELKRAGAEVQEARQRADSAQADLLREKTRADEAEREARVRVQRAEDDLAMMVEEQRSGRTLAEAGSA